VNRNSTEKSRLVKEIPKDRALPSPNQYANHVGDSHTNLEPHSCIEMDVDDDMSGLLEDETWIDCQTEVNLNQYQSSWGTWHTEETIKSSLVNMEINEGDLMDLSAEFAKPDDAKSDDDEEMVDVSGQADFEVENQTQPAPSFTPPVSPTVIPEPYSSIQGNNISQPHPLFMYRDPALADMSSKDSSDGKVPSVGGLDDKLEASREPQDVRGCCVELTDSLD
jgi:hypothetical protein